MATSMIKPEQVPTCERTYSWRFYSAAHWRNHTHTAMTQFQIESHYPDTELTSPCCSLLMPSSRLGTDKYKFDESLV